MKRGLTAIALTAMVFLSGRLARAEGTSLGLGIGGVSPGDVNSTLWFTGNLRFHLGRNFALEPELGYWKRSETVFSVEASLEDFNFGASALIVLPIGGIEIFFGGGGGGHYLKGKIGAVGLGSVTDSATKGGVHALGGIDIKATRTLSLFGAARFDRVYLGGTDNNLDETKYYGGLRLRF